MDIQAKRKRLKDALEKNRKEEKMGTAIAIIGSWGVGKTYFWENFLDSQLSEERIDKKNNIFNRKYAYVSLFGIESLSDLKTQIYSNIESYHSTIEVPKWLKSLPSIFKDTRVTQLGINAPVKLIDNLLFNQVKDAIICFDDFERMSNKLDIKDVMGLANQLKLEKNCQIILILDESKTEDKNKEKYAEYKEKLIDETIKITSVEPLIRENSKNMDEPLVDLMVKFADGLEIHNFRFFHKVIKLYEQFLEQLPEIVVYSVKKIVLVRILEGILIEDFSVKYSWSELLKKVDNENYRLLHKVNDNFHRDQLREDFFFWFSQNKKFSFQPIRDYINKENSYAQDQSIDEELRIFVKDYEQLLFHRKSIDNLSKTLKKVNIHFSYSNLIKIFSIFEELNLREYENKIYVELQELIYRWLAERTTGDNVDNFPEYLSKFFPKDSPFYQYAISQIGKEKSNDIELNLQNIFKNRVNKNPGDIENQYLMSISIDDWTEYLQSFNSREYLFDDIRWIIIQIKKGIFDQQIQENIFSAFDRLAHEEPILIKYFDNQKEKLLKEAGY